MKTFSLFLCVLALATTVLSLRQSLSSQKALSQLDSDKNTLAQAGNLDLTIHITGTLDGDNEVDKDLSEDDINKLLEGDDDDEDLLKSLKDGDESSSDDTELTDEEVKALLGDYSDTDSNDDSSDDDTELTDDEVKALLGDDESDDDDDTELTDEEKKALE